MEFFGAIDCYFWQGVEAGQKGKDELLQMALHNDLFTFYTPTVEDCEAAFIDGYMIGQELSKRDYGTLTKPRVVYKNKPVVDYSDEANTDIEGNC